MTYAGDDFQSTVLRMENGIDGLNNLADVEDGYVLDAKNVDLSSPGFIQKRPGYHLYGCALPIRVKSIVLTNGGGAEYTNVGMQFDFVPEYEVTLQLWLNDNDTNSAYGDARFFQTDDKEETVFARIKDYTTSPNLNTVTTSTVLEIQHGGSVYYTTPIAVFDNNTFILPLQPLLAAGISPNLGAGAATEKTTRFGSGPTFPSLTKEDIASIYITPLLSTVEITVNDISDVDVRLYSLMRFDAGVTSSAVTSRTGYVSSIVGNVITVTMSAAFASDSNRNNLFPRVFYCNGFTNYFKSQTVEFLSADLPSAAAKTIQSCNNLVLAADNLIITSAATGTYTDIGYLYGTGINPPQVNLLAYFYDIELLQNRIVTGYAGNVFVETDPIDRVYNTRTTGVLAAQTLNIGATGSGNITVPDSSIYEIGDTVYLDQASATDWEVATRTFTVTVKPTGTSLTLYNLDYKSTAISVLKNAKLRFSRASTTIYFRKELYDSTPIIFPGATFQTNVGNAYATHRISTVVYLGTSANYFTVENAVTWESDSTIKFGAIFAPANYPDSSTLDNYEPILSSYFMGAAVDLSHALIDRNIYIAAQKDGIWKYNGEQLINQYFPPPPPPLLTNVPGSAGNLSIVEDSDGRKVGQVYGIIVTYSYFEFVNGILTEVESGVTAWRSAKLRAEPATDGSFNSQLMEVQVKTVPRGIGLPADSIYINIYRTIDGTADGIEDEGIYYREASKLNNPDTPYVTLYAGSLTSSLLEDNGKVIYASVSGEAEDELTRNIRIPPLANHVINFQNRLIAMNGRESQYFNFSGRRVYDPDSLTSAFGGIGTISFVPADSNLTEYQFCLCPADESTTTATYTNPAGLNVIKYQVFSTETQDVTRVTFSDGSYLLNMEASASYTIPNGTRFVLRSLSRDTWQTDYDSFQFDSQVFLMSTAGTPHIIRAEKKWTDVASVGTALAGEYLPLIFSEALTSTNPVQVNVLNSGIELLNSGVTGGLYNNKVLVIRGMGTLAQMRDTKSSDANANRVFDWDTDILFYAFEKSAGSVDYDLVPLRINGVTSGGAVAYQEIIPTIDVEITNTSTGIIEGVSHKTIEIFYGADSTGIVPYAITPLDTPEAAATLTVPAALGLVPGDIVYIDEMPNKDTLSKIPNEIGIDFNRALEVATYTGTDLKVIVGENYNIFENFTNLIVAGKLTTDANVSFSSTYMEVLYPTGATAINVALEAGQWVYVIAKTSDSLKTDLQASGWYQILQVSVAAGVWISSANSGNLYGIRLSMAGSEIDSKLLMGLTNLKILAARVSGGVTGGTISYVPVPVPSTPTADITGTMFGPLDGQTPYERVIKRLGNAMSAALSSEGFAYWGADPGNISQEFPVNGFKFVNHKWPNNKYTNARDATIGFYDNNRYSLEMDLAAEYYEWDASGGRVVSDGTLQTADFIEKRYPSRFWYTPIGSDQFRDVSLFDVSSDDGEEIIGAVALEEYFLIFKESQIFKCKIETTGPIIDRVQAKIGAVSKKNIVAADSGVMFLAKSGFFYTDGNTCKKIIRMNRIFKDYIKKNQTLFPFTSGGYDPTNYLIRLGAPVADTIDGTYSLQDRHLQLNFNMKDVESGVTGGGWTINTNMPANMWLHFDESMYFGSTDGNVYRIRSEYAATRYRDDESAISYSIDTRFYDFGAPSNYKFVRETVAQLDTKYDNSLTVSSAWNFRSTYEEIGAFTLDVSALASDEIGDRYTASQKYIESRRQTSIPNRCIQLSFRLSNSTIDQGGGVHGFWAHLIQLGPKVVRQQ